MPTRNTFIGNLAAGAWGIKGRLCWMIREAEEAVIHTETCTQWLHVDLSYQGARSGTHQCRIWDRWPHLRWFPRKQMRLFCLLMMLLCLTRFPTSAWNNSKPFPGGVSEQNRAWKGRKKAAPRERMASNMVPLAETFNINELLQTVFTPGRKTDFSSGSVFDT